ncbi:flagellar type III secretion system pore protein FliP [Marinimicrobium sp. ABcell2]|uniref:flagellar type III secretion system pore protein FliP n=1 Tax=Marinimicrobium sp. ABcell2 TaxID=3069751 RepID=UPI00359C519B
MINKFPQSVAPRWLICLGLLLVLSLVNAPTWAQEDAEPGALATQVNATGLPAIPGLPALTVTTEPDGTQQYTVTLQILAIMTALTFLPALLLMMTSFTRIIIVFAILRQALGLQQSPSNQILIGLSLFLTLFIMQPVITTVNENALQPYINEQITAQEALAQTAEPFHNFMLSQTRESDIALFVGIAGNPVLNGPEDIPFSILVPAFVTSELKTAFQIGFLIFIPFLVIDIVVASVLMAMGMMMLSPLIISLPFKIMLFVLVDGWAMIIGTLAASFGV